MMREQIHSPVDGAGARSATPGPGLQIRLAQEYNQGLLLIQAARKRESRPGSRTF
jgi:hypothetical protein